MKTAVIGGGIAGLTAAHELVKKGEFPLLIEPGAIGGMIRSEVVDGFTLEQGPNVIVERPDMKALIDELQLTGEIRYPSVNPYGQFVWSRNQAMKVPAGLFEFLLTPLIPLSTKLLLPFRLVTPGLLKPKKDDLTVMEFFTPLLGEQAVRNVLDPVLKGIYGGDVDKLSARSLFPGLWESSCKGLSLIGYMRRRPKGGKPAIMVVDGGIQRVVDTLWGRLEGRVERSSARVESIQRRDSGGFRLVCSGGSSIDVDRVVITPAGSRLASMVGALDSELAAKLREVQYASLSVVHCSVPKEERLLKDAFGVLFTAGMPEDLLGVMFNSQIFPHMAPPDKNMLTVMVGGAQAGDRESKEELLRERLPGLLERCLNISGVAWIKFTRWSAAIPQLKVGHYRVVEALDRVESSNPGIVFAGVDRGGVGVSDRIRIAREGVERLSRLSA